MDLNTFRKRFEGNNPSWITKEELEEWKERMEVVFSGLPTEFQTPEVCRKLFDNGYQPKNIFASLASFQIPVYDPNTPFGPFGENPIKIRECYSSSFEPLKRSREWVDHESRLMEILRSLNCQEYDQKSLIYKINKEGARHDIEKLDKDSCSSLRTRLERFSQAEPSSIRSKIYNQRGINPEEKYKTFPVANDYKGIVDGLLEIIKEKMEEELSSPINDNSDPLESKKKNSCEEIRELLIREEIENERLHPTNQNWEDNIKKADFEWQIDNIKRKVIVNTNFVKERIKTKSDQKVVGTTSNSKLGSSPTDSLGKKLEELIQDNDFSSQRNESNQETKETQPDNVTNQEVFPWKLAVPVFLLLVGSLVLGFLITKKEKPSYRNNQGYEIQ